MVLNIIITLFNILLVFLCVKVIKRKLLIDRDFCTLYSEDICLTMPIYYGIVSTLGFSLSFFMFIMPFLAQNFSMEILIWSAIFFSFFFSISVFLFLLFMNHRLLINDKSITVFNFKAKKSLLHWEEIEKFKLKHVGGFLLLKPYSKYKKQTLKIYFNIKGFSNFLEDLNKRKISTS